MASFFVNESSGCDLSMVFCCCYFLKVFCFVFVAVVVVAVVVVVVVVVGSLFVMQLVFFLLHLVFFHLSSFKKRRIERID